MTQSEIKSLLRELAEFERANRILPSDEQFLQSLRANAERYNNLDETTAKIWDNHVYGLIDERVIRVIRLSGNPKTFEDLYRTWEELKSQGARK